jgi:hypothetical protein
MRESKISLERGVFEIQFRVHERRCTQILLPVAKLTNQSRHNSKSNEETAEICCSLAPSVRLSLGVDWKTCSFAFQGVAKVSARSH